jgi:predicted transcriptional regulator
MKTGLLSIREPYAKAILDGTKRYEFRRKAPRLAGPTRFLIYVPDPKKELAGEMLVSSILSMPPEKLWRKTRGGAGISREGFMAYFQGQPVANALVIEEARKLRRPKRLEELRRAAPEGFTPPQFLTWLPDSSVDAFLQ